MTSAGSPAGEESFQAGEGSFALRADGESGWMRMTRSKPLISNTVRMVDARLQRARFLDACWRDLRKPSNTRRPSLLMLREVLNIEHPGAEVFREQRLKRLPEPMHSPLIQAAEHPHDEDSRSPASARSVRLSISRSVRVLLSCDDIEAYPPGRGGLWLSDRTG